MPDRNEPRGLVTILANAECPHCVHAADAVTAWCAELGIPVAGVDLAHHPEAARRMWAEQSPIVLVEGAGGRRVHLGFPRHEEFLRLVQGS